MNLPNEFISICMYHAHTGIILKDYEKCEERKCTHYARAYYHNEFIQMSEMQEKELH